MSGSESASMRWDNDLQQWVPLHPTISEIRITDAAKQFRRWQDAQPDGAPGTLPTDAAERKALPMATGVLDYFPDALAAVAHVSKVGNDQHNPGQPLHWSKDKSTDHADCIVRHLVERGTLDTDGVRHSAKVAWRALALLQIEIEKENADG